MSILNTVVEEATKADLTATSQTSSVKTVKYKVKKEKNVKCNACGRWIANPVWVGNQIFGTYCAKKARIEYTIEKSRQLDLTEEIEKGQTENKQEIESIALIFPELIVKSLPTAPVIQQSPKPITKSTTELKQVGEIWINNKEIGICKDCDSVQPLFYKFTLSNGKDLACCCESCFEKNNYFNIA